MQQRRAALNFLNAHPPDLGEVKEAISCVVGDADRAAVIIDGIRDHVKKAPPEKTASISMKRSTRCLDWREAKSQKVASRSKKVSLLGCPRLRGSCSTATSRSET